MKKLRYFLIAGLLAMPLLALAKDDPDVIALSNRLNALQANPQTADVARFERLQAQQAISALAEAKRRDRDELRFLADRRVEIAETAARAAAARRQLEQVEGTRSELLIEASRREAARARQEAERLRMQSQMQAEEADQLRQQAEAEMLARQDAEQALSSVASKQTAKLSAGQQKAAQLAREEAELTSGAKLPPSKFDARGEVFAVPVSAFDGGKASLSSDGGSQVKALADYLQIGKKGRVSIVGYAGDAAAAQKRAEALRDALVAGGISASRLQVSAGKGAAGKTRSAEVVVAP
jgi:outer membrane protein OmpA-like peptidoglycan-associated protein